MLDFAKLVTPQGNGEVLVEPAPARWGDALRSNQRLLNDAQSPFLGSTLCDWRRATRKRIVGEHGGPVIVIGHQPEFIHCGVWAKHVVARRFADAVKGVAINLVVDSDAPRSTALTIPLIEDGRMTVRRVAWTEPPAGRSFEQIAVVSAAEIARIEGDVRRALGPTFEASLMPVLLRGLRDAAAPCDWVDQITAGRRAVDESFAVALDDRRVSGLWWAPFLRDVLSNMDRFTAAYNRALADYRCEHHIVGDQRPIPNLTTTADAREVPFWAYRRGEPRQRVFARRMAGSISLIAGGAEIGVFELGDEAAWNQLISPLGPDASWRLRPRALALTIWARLLLADLFIHGIGGAKYDRISDAIIADYYGITPPHMSCVSATLRLPLPHTDATSAAITQTRRVLRDLEWNPQRHLADGAELGPLKRRREMVANRSADLRRESPQNRTARRELFDEVRLVNRALLNARPQVLAARRAELERSIAELPQNRLALDREYFYALHSRTALAKLADALPAGLDFGI